jgi:aminobenzoyl-glutamate transport protein
MTVIFVPVIWFVTDRLIEPRLGTFDPAGASVDA